MTDTILVTGGAGYVGSQTCKRLAAAGFLPVTYDNLSNGLEDLVRWGPLEVGSLLDAGRLDQVIARHKPAAVMHFAGLINVGESVKDPAAFYQHNLLASLCLLDSMRGAGLRDIVFSSTCAVYGEPPTIPITEQSPLSPINPYGETKLAIERMLRSYGAAYGLRWVALRYFNACGADPDGETGECHQPELHLIPLAIQAATGKIPVFEVMGNNYETPDGTCIRDFIHTNDLAQGHLLALRHLRDGGESLALNLGTGKGWSVREVLETIGTHAGRAVPVKQRPRRPGDPPLLIADASLAKEKLGFSPEYSDLDTIIHTALTWHAKHPGPNLGKG